MTSEILATSSVSKWRIDKKFLPVKIALFCYYAGSFGGNFFLPVFLKHQGLTIANFSIFTGISVCLQFLGGVISGYLADKIGRIKPFWFFFVGMYCVACLCLATLPNVVECNIENVSFECYNDEMLNLNATYCKIIRNNPQALLCSKIAVEKGKNLVEQNVTSVLVVTLFPKFHVNLEIENLKNISGVYSFASGCTNSSIEYTTPRTSESCKSFKIDCLAHYLDCNKNAQFWIVIYGILVVLYFTAQTNVFRFNDIVVSDLTSEYNSDFGRQRMYGIVGGMVGPALVGIILNAINLSSDNGKSYTCVFVCAIIFSVLAAFSMGLVNPKFHKPACKMWKNSFKLVKNLDVMLFFSLLIVMGSVIGFQFTYRNWYLKELGASDLLTGIVSGSTNLYGIPFLYNSAWCINKIGVRNIFVLGLLGHVVYSFSYSAMEEPWIALMIESTAILSYHLFWVAAIEYSHVLAPEGLVAIMKALAGSLHFNVGKLGSSLIAGYVMSIYGSRAAFTVLGCITLGYSLVYGSYLLIIHHLKQKKMRTPLESATEKEISRKDPNFT